jgi:hypothetical protein
VAAGDDGRQREAVAAAAAAATRSGEEVAERRRQARAAVGYLDAGVPGGRADAHAHVAAAVLDRVGDEVGKGLGDPQLVRAHDDRRRRRVDVQADAAVRGDQPPRDTGVRKQLAQLDLGGRFGGAAPARRGGQVLDRAGRPPELELDRREPRTVTGSLETVQAQQRRLQRPAQLVVRLRDQGQAAAPPQRTGEHRRHERERHDGHAATPRESPAAAPAPGRPSTSR